MTDDLAFLDATAQAELVRTGQLSPVELVDAAINRIEKLNPELNAVIHPRFDQARDEAAAAGLPDGPFRGVPTLFKDLMCAVEGEPYHEGMRFLKDNDYTAALHRQPRPSLPRGRLHLLRPHEHPRARARADDRARRVRPDAQPVGHVALAGRLEWRLGRRGRGRHGAGRPRQRRRRLDPHPRELQRPRRAQAVARAHVARTALGSADCDPELRAGAGAFGARRRRCARRPLDAVPGRHRRRPGAGAPVRRRGRRRPGAAPHRHPHGRTRSAPAKCTPTASPPPRTRAVSSSRSATTSSRGTPSPSTTPRCSFRSPPSGRPTPRTTSTTSPTWSASRSPRPTSSRSPGRSPSRDAR